jgi:hypothetical protein
MILINFFILKSMLTIGPKSLSMVRLTDWKSRSF